MATANLRSRFMVGLGVLVFLTIFMTYSLRTSFSSNFGQVLETVPLPNEPLRTEPSIPPSPPSEPEEHAIPDMPPSPSPEPEEHVIPDHPTYKTEHTSTLVSIVDNFPLAAAAHSAAELPSIPPWNEPPSPHVPEKTPLFIGFTRNWRLLQQAVVSYITAGWPPEDIYVIENTGTMKSNQLGLLSLQNPFFLNHTRLHMLGVNVITTPTLLSFSQLQNFYIWMAIENNFTTYFYGHMDVIVLPFEDRYITPPASGESPNRYEDFKSIYQLAVDALRLAVSPEPDPNSSNSSKPWAARFFAYDRLALVNREAYESIGGWDTAIPYYFSDCDMHDRLKMYGFEYNGPDVEIGEFCDVSGSLDDLLVLYRKRDYIEASFTVDGPTQETAKEERQNLERVEKGDSNIPINGRKTNQTWVSDNPGSASFKQLFEVANAMVKHKNGGDPGGRNTWQARQFGGKGEPYYRDSEGFEKAIQMITQTGRDIYAEKWGHRACDLLPFGRKAGDEWRVEHDWE
ncbi:Uncharacterized protein BP5553_07321 [Venustampulla echinocandica]|uniref:Uncharacterized protein n=1 Tax=Venustampulla echinocandica TaxID=2656787 RepID=A0A370TJ70_9HELO|nr:Uncharacterized protein BP5553_07321 [Venustampulla echinocandica]RDL35390.1 Uncharacterized protein BP5553_07321 [Venustampulla echinocandica]